MATLYFTGHLRRLAPPGPVTVEASDLRGALFAVFAQAPRLKGYVLDDQDRLRRHVALFYRGERILADSDLARKIAPDDAIHVMQALSGG